MGGKKTILLIDDEKDLVEMVQFQLKAKGFEVVAAYNGLEGLERLKTVTPDLIILDMNMPKMGGVEFFKNICDQHANPRYPVFVLTARANMEHLFADFHVHGFIAKPFAIDRLISEIERVLKQGSSQNIVEQGQPAVKPPQMLSTGDISVQQEAVLGEAVTNEEKAQPGFEPGIPEKERKKEEPPAVRDRKVQKEILILENDMSVGRELKKIFAACNCDVNIVPTPEGCWEKAGHSFPDLIILKHFIDTANTEELAHRLKEMQKFYKVPIILYDTIGEIKQETKPSGEKDIALILGAEGNKMLQKAKALLGI